MILSPSIKVNKVFGEYAIKLLKKMKLYNDELRIIALDDSLLIPIKRILLFNEIRLLKERIFSFELRYYKFASKGLKPKNLKEALKDKLKIAESLLPRSFDIIGDIAVIDLPSHLTSYKKLIGEAIVELNPHIKSVFARMGKTSGIYRIRPLEHIAGTYKTLTFHREYGCIFKVDISKVYFNPKLSAERFRVACQVDDGEVIVDMFCGVGPFSILIAKRAKVQVLAIDINKYAITLLRDNISLNKLRGIVYPVHSDSKLLLSSNRLKGYADRIIMNLPGSSINFLNTACKVCRRSGIIHLYLFSQGRDPVSTGKRILEEAMRKIYDGPYEIKFSKPVREVAPFKWIIVFDLQLL